MKGCGICIDGQGFFARECHCGMQKPCDLRMALIYQDLGHDVKVGERLDLTRQEGVAQKAPAVVEAEGRDLLAGLRASGERWRQSRGRVFG